MERGHPLSCSQACLRLWPDRNGASVDSAVERCGEGAPARCSHGEAKSPSFPPAEWPLHLSLARKRTGHLDSGQVHSQGPPRWPGCLAGWKAIGETRGQTRWDRLTGVAVEPRPSKVAQLTLTLRTLLCSQTGPPCPPAPLPVIKVRIQRKGPALLPRGPLS